MINKRYVFDTNILVSALLFSTCKPAQVFQHALQQGGILVSFELLEELNEVLRREKFSRLLILTRNTRRSPSARSPSNVERRLIQILLCHS